MQENQVYNNQSQPSGSIQLPPNRGNQPVLPDITTGRNTKKIVLITLAIVVPVLIILGVIVWMLYNNSPQKVLADAVGNTANSLLAQQPNNFKAEWLLTNSKDTKDAMAVKVQLEFENHNDGKNNELTAKAKVLANRQQNDVDVKILTYEGNEVYIKLTNLKKVMQQIKLSQPGLVSTLAKYDPLVQKIDNQWVRINTKSFTTKENDKTEQNDNTCLQSAREIKLSKEDQKQLKQLYKDSGALKVREQAAKDMVGGRSSYHYFVDFDEQATRSLVKNILELPSFSKVKLACQNSGETKMLSGALEASKKAIKKPSLELWVDSNTRHFSKIRINSKDQNLTTDLNTVTHFGSSQQVGEKPVTNLDISELSKEIEAISKQPPAKTN